MFRVHCTVCTYNSNLIIWECSIAIDWQHQRTAWIWIESPILRMIYSFLTFWLSGSHLPESPLQLLLPGCNPAQIVISLNWMSAWRSLIFLKTFLQNLLSTIGTWSCIRIGDCWPCSRTIPQPTTNGLLPTNFWLRTGSSSGKQIGLILSRFERSSIRINQDWGSSNKNVELSIEWNRNHFLFTVE